MTHPAPFRRSPVRFGSASTTTVDRDGWPVALAYEDEGDGPWLVDLSHRVRWDFQDGDIASHRPLGLTVPSEFGAVSREGDLVINRMNRTQVSIWHLGPGAAPPTPPETAYTDTTDGHCMLAFVGDGLPDVLECLTSLDLFDANRTHPHLTQGPVLHVPCQVVTFEPGCVAMTFSRGYGQTFAEAALDSARPTGLRPGGEDRFTAWWSTWAAAPAP